MVIDKQGRPKRLQFVLNVGHYQTSKVENLGREQCQAVHEKLMDTVVTKAWSQGWEGLGTGINGVGGERGHATVGGVAGWMGGIGMAQVVVPLVGLRSRVWCSRRSHESGNVEHLKGKRAILLDAIKGAWPSKDSPIAAAIRLPLAAAVFLLHQQDLKAPEVHLASMVESVLGNPASDSIHVSLWQLLIRTGSVVGPAFDRRNAKWSTWAMMTMKGDTSMI